MMTRMVEKRQVGPHEDRSPHDLAPPPAAMSNSTPPTSATWLKSNDFQSSDRVPNTEKERTFGLNDLRLV